MRGAGTIMMKFFGKRPWNEFQAHKVFIPRQHQTPKNKVSSPHDWLETLNAHKTA